MLKTYPKEHTSMQKQVYLGPLFNVPHLPRTLVVVLTTNWFGCIVKYTRVSI